MKTQVVPRLRQGTEAELLIEKVRRAARAMTRTSWKSVEAAVSHTRASEACRFEDANSIDSRRMSLARRLGRLQAIVICTTADIGVLAKHGRTA